MRPFQAALPMYDWPETAPAWDALWTATRARLAASGIEARARLGREDEPHAGWLSPDLILGQTCGWPYVSTLRGRVMPLARFDFGLDTQRPGDYFSVFIARPGEAPQHGGPRGLRPLIEDPGKGIAVNATISQSGFRVLGECFAAPFTLPAGRVVLTGSHRESIRAVAAGRADLAAIDAASWQFALAHEPAAGQVAVVARSADAPGLPLIVAGSLLRHCEAVYEALSGAVAGLPDGTRQVLQLRGIVPARDGDYQRLLDPPYGNLRLG